MRCKIKTLLYYHGMAERIRWVQPPKSLLCVEIWSRFEVFGFLENITSFWFLDRITRWGGIPRTLRNCTFNIRFENGWRGCVRLAELFWLRYSENKVIERKNQILFRKQILWRISIISIPTILPYYIGAPSLLPADAGFYILYYAMWCDMTLHYINST